jgi:hypothetical protein
MSMNIGLSEARRLQRIAAGKASIRSPRHVTKGPRRPDGTFLPRRKTERKRTR